MSLGSDILATLPFLRTQAESMMHDTCTITRTGERVWNEDAGEYVTELVTVYSGKCRLRLTTSVVRELDAQSQMLAEQSPVLSLPVVGSEGVAVGDKVLLTAAHDPAGVMELRVSGLHQQTHSTARRMQVEVVVPGV